MKRVQAEVKWFDDSKGFGFAVSEEFQSDIFIHYSQIDGDRFKTLCPGQLIEVDVLELEKGLRGENVIKIGDPNV